jgi:hypothetical protein
VTARNLEPNMKKAFRCKTCGFLTHANHAGEQAVPYACQVCHAGVEFNAQDVEVRDAIKDKLIIAARAGDSAAMNGLIRQLHNIPLKKTFNPDNWEVLADAKPERLKQIGLSTSDVERHVPAKKGENREPKNISAVAVDATAVKDKAST